MAFYDLKCDDCGHKFEKFVSGFLKDGDKSCPECGSRKVTRKFAGSFSIGKLGSAGTGDGCGTTKHRDGFG